MKKFRAIFNGQYRNAKGNVVFRYIVSGTKEMIEEYKLAQGGFYRENEQGQPVWFSSRFEGKSISLILTSKGRIVADNQTIDTLTSVVNGMQVGALQTATANLAAQQIMNSLGFGTTVAAPAPVAATPTPAPAAPQIEADELDETDIPEVTDLIEEADIDKTA